MQKDLNKKMWYFYAMEYYAAIKTKELFCDSMDGPGEYYAKCNKPYRERQITYDLTHTWNLVNIN